MRGIVPLILLLFIIVGLGGTNFYRNLQKENQQERAFGSYSDADIQAMIRGLQQEIDLLNARYEAQKKVNSRSRDRGGMKENIEEFERVQTATRVVKELGQIISQKEVLLRELEDEAAHRNKNSDPLQVFLRRLTTF
jgi:cell fate (sporulation/competence/biofilm development) regulator YlbF (YheA/YmcA/DUF963 family)